MIAQAHARFSCGRVEMRVRGLTRPFLANLTAARPGLATTVILRPGHRQRFVTSRGSLRNLNLTENYVIVAPNRHQMAKQGLRASKNFLVENTIAKHLGNA